MRTCLYSSRNRQVPTVPYQPFLPAIQRSDDGSSLIFRPQETQPFLPAIQRSADGSSNSRESTQSSSPHQSPLPPVAPHPHHYLPPGTEQPGRRVPVGYDSAGGELILGWRKSALFFKSPLSERLQDASSDFWKTVLAEFRQPRSQPPTKPRRQAAHASRASVFQQKKNSNEPQIHHCSPFIS